MLLLAVVINEWKMLFDHFPFKGWQRSKKASATLCYQCGFYSTPDNLVKHLGVFDQSKIQHICLK